MWGVCCAKSSTPTTLQLELHNHLTIGVLGRPQRHMLALEVPTTAWVVASKSKEQLKEETWGNYRDNLVKELAALVQSALVMGPPSRSKDG